MSDQPQLLHLVIGGELKALDRLEFEDLTAADERRYEGKERILGRGSDEGYDAVLDIGQQSILLRAIEAV